MRFHSIATAAFIAAGTLATAAAAEEPWNGYIQAGVKYGVYSLPGALVPPGFDFDIRQLTVDARASVAKGFPMNWGAQFDLAYYNETLYEKVTSSGVTHRVQDNESSADAALHLYYRQPGRWLFGGIFQYGGALDSGSSDTHYFAGLEGQIYCGNWLFYGQGAYRAISDGSSTVDGFVVAAEVKYFLSPRWNLFSRVSLDRITESGSHVDGLIVKLGTERQFGSSGWSAFVNYQQERFIFPSSSGGGAFVFNGVYAGFRWNFGNGTIKARDTAGASLNPFDGFPLVD